MKFAALSKIVSDPEAFSRHWPEQPTTWDMSVDHLRSIMDHDDVDDMLVDQGLRAPAVRMESAGNLVPERSYTKQRYRSEPDVGGTVDPLAVAAYQQAGFSLSLHNVHCYLKSMGEFCDRLGYELMSPISVTAFLSPPKAKALALHHDPLDLFVCQVRGEKIFRLYKPVFENPLRHNRWNWNALPEAVQQSLLNSEPDLEFRLTPGSVLWIPRGWVHEAPAGDAVSLHFTLQVESATEHWIGEKFVRWIADNAKLRTNLPIGTGDSEEAMMAAVSTYLKKVQSTLQEIDRQALSRHLITEFRETFPGPKVRPIRDVLIASHEASEPAESIEFRAEGIVGYEEIGADLLVDLGSARRWFKADDAILVRELIQLDPDGNILPLLELRRGRDGGRAFAGTLVASGIARTAMANDE